MPSLRRQEPTRRREWTDTDRKFLATGRRFFDRTNFGMRLTSATVRAIDSDDAEKMRQCWEEHGAEILAEFFEHKPGRRPWYLWVFEYLPRDERRPMVDGITSKCECYPPWCDYAWEDRDGFETSLFYLVRRGLLEPGELDHLRALQADRAREWVAYRRTHAPAGNCYPADPWELAGAAFVGGVDILTGPELDSALPYLADLRRHLEDRS